MLEVSVSELRRHLLEYLEMVAHGKRLSVSRRGRIVATVVPPGDVRAAARDALTDLRERAVIGDVESPIDANWDADARP